MFSRTAAPEADVLLLEVGFTLLHRFTAEGAAFSECMRLVMQWALLVWIYSSFFRQHL